MISLSKSITNDKPNDVYAVYNSHRYLTSFTHPGDAEADDKQVYKEYIIECLQAKHTSVYKEILELAVQHTRGTRIVIITHENAHHGEIIIAAIKYMASKLKPTSPSTSPHAGLPTWQENAADNKDLIDERRFVWVTSRSGLVTRLAYVWDTEGVVTALIPTFGLVKLGRLARHFWVQRTLGHIGPRIHAANVTLERKVERTFAILIKKQISLEHIEPLRITYPFGRRHTNDASWQHQPWALREEEQPFDEEPTIEEEEAAVETEAFCNLYAIMQPEHYALYEPTKFTGPHVKPVIKTKADGSRWVLTPQMQARGALHYQPVR